MAGFDTRSGEYLLIRTLIGAVIFLEKVHLGSFANQPNVLTSGYVINAKDTSVVSHGLTWIRLPIGGQLYRFLSSSFLLFI
jgi:hypothetical protein